MSSGGGVCYFKGGYSDYFRLAMLKCRLGVAAGGASGGGGVVVVMVRVLVGCWWWWWRNGGGSGSDSLCRCNISRTAIFKYQ